MSSDASTTQEPDLPEQVKERLDAVWRKAYACENQDDLRELYADWAEGYDGDHAAIGFLGHGATAELLSQHLPPGDDVRVLDAGAGTGLAGVALANQGYGHLTAIDMSPEMLAVASAKGVYELVRPVNLSLPVDSMADDAFDGAVLVGVFSYGQAPAHALDEIVRVVRPGGRIAFTVRNDFHGEDSMGVATRMEQLEQAGAWRRVALSEPAPYLPNKDPDVMYRIWVYEVLEGKREVPPEDFVAACREVLSAPGPVRELAPRHLWDATGSRLQAARIEQLAEDMKVGVEGLFQVDAGGFESLQETRAFLAEESRRPADPDRGVVTFELCRDAEELLAAHNAGEMNRLLGADFDLAAFEAASTYTEPEDADNPFVTGRVQLAVRATRTQHVRLPALGLELEVAEGDVFAAGTARTFTVDAVTGLAEQAGLRVRSVGFDADRRVALADLVPADAPPA